MPEALADRLKRLIDESGRTPQEVSVAAGLNESAVRDILRGRALNPRVDTLKALAQVLAVPIETLTGPDVALPTSRRQRSEIERAAVVLPARADLPRDVPVYGTAAGSVSTEGSFQLVSGEAVDYVLRPPALAGARGVYAVYVTGASMEPAHPEGELRFVHPHRPVGAGDTVIIQAQYKPDGPIETYIKRLVRRNGETIVAEQFNPPGVITFERRFVVSVHKVLTMSELFGL